MGEVELLALEHLRDDEPGDGPEADLEEGDEGGDGGQGADLGEEAVEARGEEDAAQEHAAARVHEEVASARAVHEDDGDLGRKRVRTSRLSRLRISRLSFPLRFRAHMLGRVMISPQGLVG